MLDINFIKDNQRLVEEAAHNKNVTVDVARLLELYDKKKTTQQIIDDARAKKNKLSSVKVGEKPNADLIEEATVLKKTIQEAQDVLNIVEIEYQELLEKIPNMPSSDTPVGKNETENTVLREVGNKPVFDFTPLPHEVLGENLGLFNNERAAKVSGSRFTYLQNELVFLEFALVQFVLRTLTNKNILAEIAQQAGLNVPNTPFIPILPPVLIKAEAMQRMARLEPKDDRYHIPQDNLYLIGSAEHTIGAIHMDEILMEADLPLRYIGFSPSFRREAGSYGKDIKGILRMHQFDKLEMESFTLPEHSTDEQNFLVAIQEYLLDSLEIPYRVVICCTGDMGDPDARHIDLEAWLPGQDQYRETHSADLMTDYQSRRLKTRVKRVDGEMQYVHMNDATAIAMNRTLIAIMENHQQADGDISIPSALHQYLPFTNISAKQ